MPKVCKCGLSFIPTRPDQEWHSKECRQKHRIRTTFRPFVGIDGEGIGSKYVLLAAGNGASIASKKGLSTEQCLEFLLNLPRGSSGTVRPLYVWFAFNYDVNMILGDIPMKEGDEPGSIWELRLENETHWRGYFIRYFPGKFLQIARGKRIHTSYDTWSFHQGTFEKALDNFKIPCPEIISEGKSQRNNFARWSLKKIAEYNDAELIALAQLTEKLRSAIEPLCIPIQSWHGPGAIAQGWLRKNKAGSFIAEPSEEMKEGVNCAYFGGRIDAVGYGFVNPVHHYDLVSAYPSGARFLPDLSSLRFIRTLEKPQDDCIYLAKIRWEIADEKARWGPFPWRSKNGTIRYPLSGEGWYWHKEIEAAIENYPWGFRTLDFLEIFQGDGNVRYPFKELIEEAFAYRNELKQKGDLSHIAIKLMLNSIYGKFAQTVGKPRFHCLSWAGLITSYTRGELLKVIDENTVCVMTDSIWSSQPLNVPTGKGLGEWEMQDETELVLAEAGLYSALDPQGNETLWQRGFNKETPLDIRGIVKGWLTGDVTEQTYQVQRFIGMGLASMTKLPWREWVTMDRSVKPVSLHGTTKRYPHFPHDAGCQCEGATFIPLDLYPADEPVTSYPYLKEVVDLSLMELKLEDECAE